MEEGKAKLLALACSVLGLAILYGSSILLEQSSVPASISTLSLDYVGSSAKVCGNITEARATKGAVFLTLDDGTGSIRLVVFNNTHTNQSIYATKKGGTLCAFGQTQEYPPGSGEIELVGRKVVL